MNSMASCFDAAWIKAKPPTTSFDSVNGPSITLNFPPRGEFARPNALGKQPSVASSLPDFMHSSISFPISSISCWVGGVPSGFGGFIQAQKSHGYLSPVFLVSELGLDPMLNPGSTNTSNGAQRNRQQVQLFFRLRHVRRLPCPGATRAPQLVASNLAYQICFDTHHGTPSQSCLPIPLQSIKRLHCYILTP